VTTGTSLDDGRRWAAELLDVAEVAPRAEVRRAYLERLRDYDFQPPRSLRDALRVLEGRCVPGIDEDRLREEEARLRAEVESFAEEFFDLSVGERRLRWDALSSACRGVPPLAARLRALRAGLGVETAGFPSDESFAGLLAEQLLRAFALPPLAQAASRQAFLRQIEEPAAEAERPSWEKAARRLRADRPALASLDDEFVRHVVELRGRLARRAKLRRAGRQRREAAPAGGGQGIPWWAFALCFSVIGALVRGFTKSDQSTSPTTPIGYPKLVLPDFGRGPDRGPNLAISELCDPSKFDVEVIGTREGRTFRFTPRPGSAHAGGGPQFWGEAAMRLLGVPPAQVNRLISRAEAAKRLGDAPKTPPERVGPQPPPAEKTRP
jgi:hypothetical protein